jgi:hypothetical protein
MIITWAATGTPRYPSEDGTIPYISDIGASYLKPLFITGCSITAVGFVTCLLIERLLRNHGRYVSGPSRLTHRVLNSDTPHQTGRELPQARTHPCMARCPGLVDRRRGACPPLRVRHAAAPVSPPSLPSRLHGRCCPLRSLHYPRVPLDLEGLWRLKATQTGLLDEGHHRHDSNHLCYCVRGHAVRQGPDVDECRCCSRVDDRVRLHVCLFPYVFISSRLTIRARRLYLLTFWYDLHLSKGRHRGELAADRLMGQQYGPGRASLGNGYYRPSTDTRATAGQPVGYRNGY